MIYRHCLFVFMCRRVATAQNAFCWQFTRLEARTLLSNSQVCCLAWSTDHTSDQNEQNLMLFLTILKFVSNQYIEWEELAMFFSKKTASLTRLCLKYFEMMTYVWNNMYFVFIGLREYGIGTFMLISTRPLDARYLRVFLSYVASSSRITMVQQTAFKSSVEIHLVAK